MSVPIKIKIGGTVLSAELFDTACAKQVAESLPLSAYVEEWGDEFYFPIPVTAGLDQAATSQVKVGDIGYWPPGKALAIFFGPTPMSRGADPVAASPVNIVGRILGDATRLKKEKGSGKITISREESP